MNETIDFNDSRLPTRFWNKVEINSETGCWEWIGAISTQTKYSAFHVGNGKRNTGHRYIMEFIHGRIDSKLHIDHLCRVRKCVNPEHLEIVTSRENNMRGYSLASLNAKKTHCPQGHKYDVIKGSGGRSCRQCQRDQRQWKGNLKSAERTSCPKGHTYTGDNLIIEPSTGRRRCRKCKLDTQARNRAKKRKSVG